MSRRLVEKICEDADDVWTVYPSPGYVLKFKEVSLGSDLFPDDEKYKVFLNVCHCMELPPPIDDIGEDEVAAILDSEDPSRYKIPISVGEIECIKDNKGINSAKIDIVVNSTFFFQRLEKSEFFRQLFVIISTEAIEKKHRIPLVSKEAIKLKNRKVIGIINAQRIKKKPEKPVVCEVAEGRLPVTLSPRQSDDRTRQPSQPSVSVVQSTSNSNCKRLDSHNHLEADLKTEDSSKDSKAPFRKMNTKSKSALLIQEVSSSDVPKVWTAKSGISYTSQIVSSRILRFVFDLQKLNVPSRLMDSSTFKLEMNENEVNLSIANPEVSVAHVLTPIYMDYEKAECVLSPKHNQLRISVPIDWRLPTGSSV